MDVFLSAVFLNLFLIVSGIDWCECEDARGTQTRSGAASDSASGPTHETTQ